MHVRECAYCENPVQKAFQAPTSKGPYSIVQLPEQTAKSSADGREVSADLERLKPLLLRGLPHARLHSAEHRRSARYLDKHSQRLRAPL